jgi:hypothetical protein
MKTSLSLKKPLQKCESLKTSFESTLTGFTSPEQLLQWAQSITLLKSAKQVLQVGRVALSELVANKRLLVGVACGVLGFGSLFSQHLFSESPRNWNWFYINWFYFIEAIRFWIAISFFSLSFIFCSPQKWKISYLAFSLSFAVGICGVVNYSFFVHTNEEFNSVPSWFVLIPSMILGVGFALAANYLCFKKYHHKDGNLARVKGIVIAPNISIETRFKHLEALVNESQNFNARI